MLNILFVIGLPFLLALLLPVINRLPRPVWIISGALLTAFVVLLQTAYQPVIVEQSAAVFTLSWLPQYGLSLSFYLDSLALLFGLIVTGIGTVVHFYAGYYFEEEEERTRFMRLLLLFSGAMLWLVLSGNLITLFIAWELTSILSFLLIGFKGYKYASAREGAMTALIVTGGGGLALLAGVLMLGAAGGSYELGELLALDLSAHSWYIPMTILILLGAFTKSAQFPFHFWLPGAMDAPTPASAFLHSATMVKAGIYLLARLHPVLGGAEFWSNTLLTVGLTTLLISSVLALRQPDLKGLLAYTTTGKLGALVALLGVPGGYGVKAALVGILAHALYKSALFLSVGSIDHATGTRLVAKLGGLWKQMPITGVVVIISALSMAGVPPLLGFVAKETMLEAFFFDSLALIIVLVSAILTAACAYVLIWDVFFRKPAAELHFHALPQPMEIILLLLAGATVLVALLLGQVLIPLLTPLVPVQFKLVLFPGFNEVFFLSMAAIAGGFLVFFVREPYRKYSAIPLNANRIYRAIIASVEWIADQVLRTQNGKLRHYLIVVLSVVMIILLYGQLIQDLLVANLDPGQFILADILDVMLLVLAVGAAWVSVLVRRHLHAALALAIMGYAIAGVFLVEPAPDVALVQVLVETLATVVMVIMISRVSPAQREAAIQVVKRRFTNRADAIAKIRDIGIAVFTGVCMFAFALVALTNRDNRNSIAAWHLENTYEEVGVTDVVSAIVTDFRGTDTLIEIGVFAIAALGLLALLTINRESTGKITANPIVATPMMRVVASIVMVITLVIAVVHILYGASAPGDGFTAGVVAGLGVTISYVVFGYDYVRERLKWVRPGQMVTAGLLLAFANGLLPIASGGAFMGFINFAPDLNFANLKLSTTLFFEIAIALTVFGGVNLIMEAIAHPSDVRTPDEERNKAAARKMGLETGENAQ